MRDFIFCVLLFSSSFSVQLRKSLWRSRFLQKLSNRRDSLATAPKSGQPSSDIVNYNTTINASFFLIFLLGRFSGRYLFQNQ
jgi:hypothetical protein